MDFYSGPRGTERWWDRRSPGWQGSASKTSTPGDLGIELGAEGTWGSHLPWGLAWEPARCQGCRTRCSRRKTAARGAGMVTLLLPEGCADDSGVALPGQGAFHRPGAASERASGTGGGWGGAQPSVGRRLLGSAGRSPRFMVQRPRGKGEGGGRTESGRPPWPGSPICREERGRQEPGAGATEGAETRPNWSEVDSGKGWVGTGACWEREGWGGGRVQRVGREGQKRRRPVPCSPNLGHVYSFLPWFLCFLEKHHLELSLKSLIAFPTDLVCWITHSPASRGPEGSWFCVFLQAFLEYLIWWISPIKFWDRKNDQCKFWGWVGDGVMVVIGHKQISRHPCRQLCLGWWFLCTWMV